MSRKFWNIFLLLNLPFQIFIINIIAGHPVWVENFYSNFVYLYISQFLRSVFGFIPVPIGQIIFYVIIGYLIFWIFKQSRKLWHKQLKIKGFLAKIGLGAIGFLSGFYFLFTILWGLNYYRVPVQGITHIQKPQINTAGLEQLCIRLIKLTNDSRGKISLNGEKALDLKLSPKQMLKMATKGFSVLSSSYPKFAYKKPAVKVVYIPQLMSVFGIGGIYFPFTGEANVNMDPPKYLLPSTICHEMAHQIGFASEDEANYVSYLACRTNPDPAFQYSGNLMAMKYAMNRLGTVNPAAFEKLKLSFSPGLQQDLLKSKAYWESFRNPLDIFAGAINDLFLKANDQDAGLQSYNQVVELLMGEYQKDGLNY